MSRCRSHEMMVPHSYHGFLIEVKAWISTCVASQTKNSEGVALRRENELVDSNVSLLHVWLKIRQFSGIGVLVTILADYKRNNEKRVSAINFSYRPSPSMIAVENLRKKINLNSLELDMKFEFEIQKKINEVHRKVEKDLEIKNNTITRKWMPLKDKVNVLIYRKREKQDHIIRLQGGIPLWQPSLNLFTRVVSTLVQGAKTGVGSMEAAVGMKVAARAKIMEREELKKAKDELFFIEIKLENTLKQLKLLENELISKYGKDAFDKWFSHSTPKHSSPNYPAR